MYCVKCGSLLQRDNPTGLVCQPCKQAYEKQKHRSGEQPVCIHYCFRCGRPYQPQDSSIHHRFCSPKEQQPALSLRADRENDNMNSLQEARTDTYVLL